MMGQTKISVKKICVIIGMCVIAVAAVLTFLWQWGIHSAESKAKECVQEIDSLIPTPQSAIPEERKNNSMSILSVDGTDFVGILEMSRYESTLPVCAEWGHIAKYPCKFSGSIYDGTLKIGATSQKGQYDFYREISVGDTVAFTDVEGNRYTYTVTNLQYEKHADQMTLNREKSALTLFIKNVYDFEYLIVSCNVAN